MGQKRDNTIVMVINGLGANVVLMAVTLLVMVRTVLMMAGMLYSLTAGDMAG